MSISSENHRFRIEKVAPEGGWGYLIVIGFSIPSACFLGGFASFGLLFNDFLTNLGAGTSAVTTIFGFFALSTSVAGLFTNTLINKFSLRSVGVFGAILFSLGSFMSSFVTSVEYLIISYGVCQGVSMGLLFSVGYTNFNLYFVKRRIFMMSVMQVLKGLLTAVYPIVVQFLVERYGFRGATAILAAIHSNAIVGMLIMHPVEWHYKSIKVPIEEVEPLMISNGEETDVKITVIPESDNPVSSDAEKNDNVILTAEIEQNKSRDTRQNLGDLDMAKEKGNDISEEFQNGTWQKVVNFLNLYLLKDLIYVNIAIGIALSLYSDGTFFTLLPMYLFQLGFSKSEAASVVATGFVADLTSRLLLAIVSYKIQLKARYVYLTGAMATILIRIVFLNVSSFYSIAVVIAIMGVFRTFFHCTIALMFADHLPSEKFAAGYGLFMFIQGILMFLISPIFGWIRDVTKSYVICFNTLTSLMCVCVIPWIIEMLWFRFHSPKKVKHIP